MTAEASGKTRRTEGVLTGGRSARVVDAVLRATVEELARAGYGGLRVDAVATRSGVNKTSVYRRWPTKAELVAAAVAATHPSLVLEDSGDLREDLVSALRALMDYAGSEIGQGLFRVMLSERADPEVEAISERVRSEQRAARLERVERAIAQGELPAGTDPALVVELVFSPATRMLLARERLSEPMAAAIVDTVLAGIRARAAPRPPR